MFTMILMKPFTTESNLLEICPRCPETLSRYFGHSKVSTMS